MDELSVAQLQQQAIENEISNQNARVNAASSELEASRAASAEAKFQLEQEARSFETALDDLRRRYASSQNELASAQVEVGETLEVARRKSDRAVAFK